MRLDRWQRWALFLGGLWIFVKGVQFGFTITGVETEATLLENLQNGALYVLGPPFAVYVLASAVANWRPSPHS
jgi:hypothetical protein